MAATDASVSTNGSVSKNASLVDLVTPRQYGDANASRDVDFNNLKLSVDSTSKWRVYKRLGQGKYSEVFEGRNTETGEVACVKILKPVIPKLFKLEVYVLQELSRGPNIVQLYYTLKDERTDLWCLVFELLACKELKEITKLIGDLEMRFYLFQILRGLDYAHSQGIMHRDVKPANILIDIKHKQVRIIDWGLACFFYPSHDYNVRVATRSYKAPELLCKLKRYHYAIDVWAVGCILAGVMFNKQYFFHGKDLPDQLIKIIEVVGSDELIAFCTRYGLEVPQCVKDELSHEKYAKFDHKIPRKDWREMAKEMEQKAKKPAKKFVSEEALDLLAKLLTVDPKDRITASEAMKHPYFDTIRDQIDSENPKFEDTEQKDEKK